MDALLPFLLNPMSPPQVKRLHNLNLHTSLYSLEPLLSSVSLSAKLILAAPTLTLALKGNVTFCNDPRFFKGTVASMGH